MGTNSNNKSSSKMRQRKTGLIAVLLDNIGEVSSTKRKKRMR